MARTFSLALLSGGLLLTLGSLPAAAAGDARLADAVERQDRAAARALLQRRVEVNAPQPSGATALHWAAHWDDAELADLLIGAGANINAANEYGVTPLGPASSNGSGGEGERVVAAGRDADLRR